jgi:hypothetical protein
MESYYRHRAERIESAREYRAANFETYAEIKERRGPDWMKKKIRQVTLSKYRVNQKWHDTTRAAQNGCCGICGVAVDENAIGTNRLYIDHDHACCNGARACKKCVRGLLCRKCNIRLDGVDDLDWLPRAITYLNRFRAHPIDLRVLSEHPAKNPCVDAAP